MKYQIFVAAGGTNAGAGTDFILYDNYFLFCLLCSLQVRNNSLCFIVCLWIGHKVLVSFKLYILHFFKLFNDNGCCRAAFVLCSCGVFVFSLWLVQYRATISLNIVNWLSFGMDTCYCFLRGRNWSLCITLELGTIPQSFTSGLVSKTGRGIYGGERAKSRRKRSIPV